MLEHAMDNKFMVKKKEETDSNYKCFDHNMDYIGI